MTSIRRAVILAGGEGTRLRPVTLEIPKPLVPVQGVPIASWLLQTFARYGVEKVTVIYPTRWKQAFLSWGGRRHPVAVELFEEREVMGTMGALVHEFTHGHEPFFVTNGDELKGVDLSTLAAFHVRERAADASYGATIALLRVPNPSEYGVAEMDGTRIIRFHEKPVVPPSTLISSGLYVIEPSALAEVSRDRRFLMFEKDFFPQLATERRLGGCSLEGQWFDCGTMERWEKAILEWRPPESLV